MHCRHWGSAMAACTACEQMVTRTSRAGTRTSKRSGQPSQQLAWTCTRTSCLAAAQGSRPASWLWPCMLWTPPGRQAYMTAPGLSGQRHRTPPKADSDSNCEALSVRQVSSSAEVLLRRCSTLVTCDWSTAVMSWSLCSSLGHCSHAAQEVQVVMQPLCCSSRMSAWSSKTGQLLCHLSGLHRIQGLSCLTIVACHTPS